MRPCRCGELSFAVACVDWAAQPSGIGRNTAKATRAYADTQHVCGDFRSKNFATDAIPLSL